MKKVYFKYDDRFERYTVFENSANNHSELNYFKMALGNDLETGVCIDYDGEVLDIYFKWNMSFAIEADIFDDEEQRLAYIRDYQVYQTRRMAEMPRVVIKKTNFKKAYDDLKLIYQGSYQYIMLSLRKEDGYDVVDIEGKHELSQEDQDYIAKEHKLYLLYKQAREVCEFDTMPIWDYRWRSPRDSVFNADVEKYLHRQTGLINGDKAWSKAEIIQNVLRLLKEGEPTYIVVHSIASHHLRNIADPDEKFKKIIEFFYDKDFELQKVSRQQLQEVFEELAFEYGVDVPKSTKSDC